jgi:hypothetical protein
MVIVSANGRVNRTRQSAESAAKWLLFALYRLARRQRVYAGFIAMLKLPFKFDLS